MEILINRDYGGFGLSEKAEKLILKGRGIDVDNLSDEDYSELRKEVLFDGWNYRKEIRTNTDVLRIVKKLGLKKAAGKYSVLCIAVVPDNVYFEIDDYDGVEYVTYSFTPMKPAKYLDDDDEDYS